MDKTSRADIIEEFKTLAKPLNEWLQKNYDPHCNIIISYDGAEVVRGELGISFEVQD